MHQNISASKGQLRLIEQLDLQVWESWIAIKQGPDHSSSPIVYRCICPLCNGKTAKKQKSQSSSHSFTAIVYRHRDADGLGYSCAACKAHFPSVYHFLGPGSAEAEQYAQARFKAGCCGRGWGCPEPQAVKQDKAFAKAQRAAEHRERDERLKAENKLRYALRQMSSKEDPSFP